MSNKSYPFFPWSDDEDDCQLCADVPRVPADGLNVEPETEQPDNDTDDNYLDPAQVDYNWQPVLAAGIQVSTPGFRKTCAEIIDHSSDVFLNFRDSFGGATCIFKFGITSDPLRRWGFYRADGYERMVVILMSAKVGGVEMLEAHLISKYGHIMGCRNVALGGEGNIGRFPPPYFVYIVGARADRPIRVA
jgi:hypothetical protein